MTETDETLRIGGPGQTYLSGPTLFLRGVIAEDAAEMAAWHADPWPVPVEIAEERIKEEILQSAKSGEFVFVAVRHADDRPVGSVTIWTDDHRWHFITLHSHPLLGADSGDAIRAEILRLVVPWIIEERKAMAVMAEFPAGLPVLLAAARELGMSFCYRLREAALVDGHRQDLLALQAWNPAAADRYGEPPASHEGPVDRPVRSPAPLEWPLTAADWPAGALMLSERLYLRPIEPDDARLMAAWSLQDTEADHLPRWPRSQVAMAAWQRGLSEQNPPDWIRFAICLRENDEPIGANGIDIDWLHRTAETESEFFRPQHRGKGYGTEAKHLLLAYAFDRLDLHMVRSYVGEPNRRSAAALRKQGYRDAGAIPWRYFGDGAPFSDIVFDLLASEWRAARR